MPCIIADDLSPKQVKAYRLADNKVSEFSDWDFPLLNVELDEIGNDIDMSNFGFPEIDDDLGVSDDDFISGTEITKKKEKTVVCPYCGKEFEV